MNTKVHCYSGHTYAERPDWFRWEGTDHKVQEVVREWQEPGERHFRVRTKDNRLFELCYDIEAARWTLKLTG